jgi:hypothetical protein
MRKDEQLGVWFEGRFIPAIGGGTGIEIAALAVAAVGMAVSAYGAYSATQAQQQQLKQQKAMNESEAAMAEEAGKDAAARQRMKDSYALASFSSKAAAAGTVAKAGSSLVDELDFATNSELEARHVQYGYEVQAAQKRTGANFDAWQANRLDPAMSAGTSLLTSAGSIAGSYGTGTPSGKTAGGIGAGYDPGNANMLN